MPFSNRIRLPLKITRPQFPQERTAFRKANGQTKTLSVVIKKIFEGETDWMPEKWHEKIVIAFGHDVVNIEGDKYLGGISQEGDYDIEWTSFLDYPTAKAKFKVQASPFNATNSNCQTCEEAAQVDLQDDTVTGIYGALEEGTQYNWDVADNDTICCHPAIFSVSTFNTDVLVSAVISQTGIITIVTKTGLMDANTLLLLTYRVTCPNGGYDEASVFGSINGTVAGGCLAPLNLTLHETTTTTARFTWNAPNPAPADGYFIEVTRAAGGPIQSGGYDETFPTDTVIQGLEPDTDYIFYIRSVCGVYSQSNNISIPFSTQRETEVCGNYEVTYQQNPDESPAYILITYTDCNGLTATRYIVSPDLTITLCALQSAPGIPIYINSSSPFHTSIEYLGPC